MVARRTDKFRIAGVPRANLTVVPEGPGGHLFLYLYAASDEGMDRLGWGQFDLRFRKSSTELQAVEPGRRLKVSFEVQPLDTVVAKSERLNLVVSSGTGWNRLPSALNLPIEIVTGKTQSRLDVVRVRPSASDFFKPAEG